MNIDVQMWYEAEVWTVMDQITASISFSKLHLKEVT